MYTALVLDAESQDRLKSLLGRFYFPPDEWKIYAHHMTINLGKADSGPARDLMGKEGELTVTDIGCDNRVIAVRVESTVPSMNVTKHVTLAVNQKAGGKPKHSNELSTWTPLPEKLTVKGTVQEVG